MVCPQEKPPLTLKLPEAPRFRGFVTGNLSSIEKAVDIPITTLRALGPHACFGYRLLEDSFRELHDFFSDVIELCGSSDVPCSTWGRSPGTDRDVTRLASSSSNPQTDAFTAGDYVDSDEDLEAVIARLQREEAPKTSKGSLAGPSVRHNSHLPALFV